MTILRNKDITQLLSAYRSGESEALDPLYSAVYRELHLIAKRQVAKSWSVDTICATSLISESYLKLFSDDKGSFANRDHFYAVAATAMRQIILNYAQHKAAQKRGGDWQRVTVEHTLAADQHSASTLLRVSEAIEEIASVDSSLAQLVEMRFFAGMNESEIATIMGVSDRTVRRNWKKAKALLIQILSD